MVPLALPLLAHFQGVQDGHLRRAHGNHQNRTNAPVLQSGMIVVVERESANQEAEGIYTVFNAAERGRGVCARAGGVPPVDTSRRAQIPSPESLEMDALRLRAVHSKGIAKMSSAKTWIAKKEGDARDVVIFSLGR